MARRRSEPNACKSASVALLLLAMCYCLPTVAATPAAIEETVAAMERNDRSPARLLAPQAEAAIRSAFRDNDEKALERRRTGLSERVSTPSLTSIAENEADTETDKSAEEESDSGMTTRLPGVSAEELVRYKKVMFRRDI